MPDDHQQGPADRDDGLLAAAATGDPPVALTQEGVGQAGRRSRWWWQPSPPDGLVVYVAMTAGGPAGGLPVAGDARDPLAREHTAVTLSAGISAELAVAAVARIFQAGLALEAAASLLPRPAAALVVGVVDDLDQLVRDIRDAALKRSARRKTLPPPRGAHSEAGIAAITTVTPQPAGGAGELLDSVVNGIFTAARGLQAAMNLPLPEAAAEHITEALHCLDEVVREVRDHMLTGRGQQAQPGQPAGPGSERAQSAANHMAALRERREALRERVTQTAYAVHLAAADTAALLDRQGDLATQPGRIDYPVEIKRWRAFADQAKQMAERWEHL